MVRQGVVYGKICMGHAQSVLWAFFPIDFRTFNMAKDKELSSPQQNQAENKRLALLDAEAKESQTLTLIAKRLRAAKKKVKRAEEIEAIKAGGKDINADQVELKTRSHRPPNLSGSASWRPSLQALREKPSD